jgi:regulator of sirC expression with transglutaminase-like and TPR domain
MNGFLEAAERAERTGEVVRAGLLLAREEYAGLDVALYEKRFEELVEGARGAVGRPSIPRLNDFFFGAAGFRGNDSDYYDPRNSYLNDVLDRKLGIPITLSVVYAELGRRLGLPTAGVGFPGRYLVRCGDTLIDCFAAQVVNREGCQEILDAIYGGKLRFREEHLRPSTARETLGRMLNNLRTIFTQRREVGRALRFAELAVMLQPAEAEPLRDRGMLLLQADAFGRAAGDLEEYLRRAPSSPDAAVVREHLDLAKKLIARLN